MTHEPAPGTAPARAPDAVTPSDDGAGWSWLRTASWVVYDLANTIYIATVTFVFTPYARDVLGGLKWHGVTNFLSMAVAALLVPFFGALVDTTGRAGRYLVVSTLLCVGALAGLYRELRAGWLLLCFFVSNLAYNLALLFYNSLLTSVAPFDRAGRVSGLGVGVGYFATILVLLIAPLEGDGDEKRAFFALAAGLFLVFALPCMVLVRDRRTTHVPEGPSGAIMRDANRRLLETLRDLPRHRPLMWFLIGNFCLVDVLNTAVLYFADFTKEVFREASVAGFDLLGSTLVGGDGLSEFLRIAGLGLNGLALVVGVSIGAWTDRAPLTVMRVSAVGLLFALIGGAAFGGESALGYLLTLVTLGAFGLTGIWTAGRKIVVLLAPPDQIGQYFGLYGITVKLSVVGAVVYGLVNDGYGSKPAMLAQSTQLLLGLACLLMVRLPRERVAATA